MKDYDFEESNSQWKFFLLGYLAVVVGGAVIAIGLAQLLKFFQ